MEDITFKKNVHLFREEIDDTCYLSHLKRKKMRCLDGVREEIDDVCYLSFEEKQNVGVLMEFVRRLIMHVTTYLKSKEGSIMDGHVTGD